MHAASHATERAMSISGTKDDHVARSPQTTGQASGALSLDARRGAAMCKNDIVHANYANGWGVMLAWRRCDTALRATWCRRFLRRIRRRNDKNDKAGFRWRARRVRLKILNWRQG